MGEILLSHSSYELITNCRVSGDEKIIRITLLELLQNYFQKSI